MRIGVMSAMEEENALLKSMLSSPKHVYQANRVFTIGLFQGHEVVLAFSRWGKVASALTATYLITGF